MARTILSIKFTFKTLMYTILAYVMISCSAKKGFQANNVNYIYDTRNLALRPEFKIYHLNDSVSQIYYRVNSNNLLYMRQNADSPYKANFSLHYALVPSFENTTVIDSGAFVVEDVEMSPPQKVLQGHFDIHIRNRTEDQQYVLRVIMTDIHRNQSFENFLRISRSNAHSEQNFLMTDTSGNVLFKNHVATNAPFYLSYNSLRPEKYFVSYYHRDFPVALPPYSTSSQQTFELNPDSSFTVETDKPVILQKSGFYHFRLDTTQWEGFTVYSFYNQFPYIARRTDLGPPLRYLTTKKEYDEISAAAGDPVQMKKIVDEFWLSRAGSIERSKILVEAYYSRVQEANMFFSSYLEGWKTDRGIIYVIYGPPDKVYRSTAGEAWVYGDENSSLSYYFNFLKVNNPFTNNDFSLNRMNSYRYGWGQAIESWRNGRIYNSKDIQREQDQSDQYRYRQRAPYWY